MINSHSSIPYIYHDKIKWKALPSSFILSPEISVISAYDYRTFSFPYLFDFITFRKIVSIVVYFGLFLVSKQQEKQRATYLIYIQNPGVGLQVICEYFPDQRSSKRYKNETSSRVH